MWWEPHARLVSTFFTEGLVDHPEEIVIDTRPAVVPERRDDQTSVHRPVHIFRCIGNVLTSLERFRAKCSQSPVDTKLDQSESFWLHIRKVYLQFLDLKKRFNWLHNEHEKLWMISEKQLEVLCSNNKGSLLLPLINVKRLRSETLSMLWQHNYNVQMRVRQLEHEAYARFSQRQMELLSRFSQGANQALERQREILVTEVTSEVWRRDEQVHDLRTDLNLHALHSEDVTQQQSLQYAGPLDRIGSGNTTISRDVSRISSCSICHWTRNWKTSTKRSRTSTRSTTSQQLSEVWCSILKGSDALQSRESGVPPILTRNLQTKIESQKYLCWWKCCYIDIICQQNYGTSNQSSATRWRWPRAAHKESIQCRKQLRNWLQLRAHHKRESRKLQWHYTILLFRRLLCQLKVKKQQWQSLNMEEESKRGNDFCQMASTSRIQKFEN